MGTPANGSPAPRGAVAFRVRLGALWRQVFPVGVAAAAASALGRWASGQPFSWPSTLPLAGAAAVIVLALHLARPVRADAQGIDLLHRLGFRRRVRWDEIAAVTFGSRLPLEPGFRVTDKQGRVLWLPRHTSNLRALHAMAVEFGGATHPLARALATPFYDMP